MKSIRLIIFGTPIPQGSMRAFIPKGWNRAIITGDNPKTKPWRQEIAAAADEAMRRQKLPIAEDVPIVLTCTFYFVRPKTLKKSVSEKLTRPDWDKLARSLCDSLTGTVYKDDSQITEAHIYKKFDSKPRAEILVEIGEHP